ncbi:hypothetical protein HNQ02_002047 [Flavobacterium sp. 7E]|uniref:hypothetical protein n=1 Tax=Flavobacterium sp. 7E TaxID=2735898 RepID=UPI0020C681DA|nr:hypothetical protein [Flavobacterium sp. 7E]NRS89125.1 hypothetical protein [Flavobacterium sp. 7E]
MNLLFVNIGYALLLMNTVLYFKGFSNQGKTFKIFTVYLLGTVLIQIASKTLLMLNNDNLFLSHFYFIGQFVMLSLFFKSLFKIKKQKLLANWILLIGIAVLAVQYSLSPNVFFRFNLFEIFLTSFLIIILAVVHLYNLLTEKKVFYYCTVGMLLYLFSSTVLFFVGNLSALLSKEYQLLPWTLNALLIIVYQLFILFEWKKSFYIKQSILKNENKPTL